MTILKFRHFSKRGYNRLLALIGQKEDKRVDSVEGKNQFIITRTFSGYIRSYEHIAKRIKLFCGREVTDLAPFDIDSPLYNLTKKFAPFIRFIRYSK